MKGLNRIGVVVVAATASALAMTMAMAQTATPAKDAAAAKAAIDARVAHFKEIKKYYEPMTEVLKNKRPFDAAEFQTNSAKLKELAAQIPGKYTVDTRQFKDIKTEGLEGIWTSQADFKAKSDAMVTAAGALSDAAKTGDRGATMKAVPALGKTCGGCHDSYRHKS